MIEIAHQHSVSGYLTVELISADIPKLLRMINECNIELKDLQQSGALSIRVQLRRQDYSKLRMLSKSSGASIRVTGKTGMYWSMKMLLHRPVLLLGIMLIVFGAWWLPTRILFITVEGNASIPTALILEKAETCGISFGTSRKAVRSENMKNNLLAAIPQLQWAGINTVGCTAVISVEERNEQMHENSSHGVSSIVAARDGIILSCTVTGGNALCKEGQAVKAGQILVSGYTDCGISIRAERAEGEIFAQTLHEICVLTPQDFNYRGTEKESFKKYSILLGKKRINLYKDSGISGDSCVKMYKEYYLTLPGGFRLPIALAVEQWSAYGSGGIPAAEEGAQDVAADFAQAYLKRSMISGQILGAAERFRNEGDLCVLTGRYICTEMIGREQNEEIMVYDRKNH